MSLNLVTTPLWPLPAIEPSEAGAFRQQAKRLLLNAFADSDSVAGTPRHETIEGSPHALACAIADLLEVMTVALAEGTKPRDERVAGDVLWEEETLRDVLTAEIDGISIRIQRTLTGQDNEDVKTTR